MNTLFFLYNFKLQSETITLSKLYQINSIINILCVKLLQKKSWLWRPIKYFKTNKQGALTATIKISIRHYYIYALRLYSIKSQQIEIHYTPYSVRQSERQQTNNNNRNHSTHSTPRFPHHYYMHCGCFIYKMLASSTMKDDYLLKTKSQKEFITRKKEAATSVT